MFSWCLGKPDVRNMLNRVMGNSVRFSKTFSSSWNLLIWYPCSYNCANRCSKILTNLWLRSVELSVFVCYNGNDKVPKQFSQTFSPVFQQFSKLIPFYPNLFRKKTKPFLQQRKHRRKHTEENGHPGKLRSPLSSNN